MVGDQWTHETDTMFLQSRCIWVGKSLYFLRHISASCQVKCCYIIHRKVKVTCERNRFRQKTPDKQYGNLLRISILSLRKTVLWVTSWFFEKTSIKLFTILSLLWKLSCDIDWRQCLRIPRWIKKPIFSTTYLWFSWMELSSYDVMTHALLSWK